MLSYKLCYNISNTNKTSATITCVGYWQGSSCFHGALKVKEQHEADIFDLFAFCPVFVLSLLPVVSIGI